MMKIPILIISTTLLLSSAQAQTPASKEITMHAKGSFDVRVLPQKPDNPQEEKAGIGRMSLDKQFHGDLEGQSDGEMLSFMTDVKGSAGYVAIERVTGKLNGHSGSFVLQHDATMTRGTPQMNIVVVPDSGTGELAGISGSLTITIIEGKHFFEFDYSLPPQK
ncbi:MAG: DUF3224 domain-containing protein [Terriglobales bacterium]